MSSKIQGTVGTLVFIGAIATGMYLGSNASGETADAAALQALQQASQMQQRAQSAAAAALGTSGPAVNSTAPGTAPGSAPGTAPQSTTTPAFGAAAYKEAEAISNGGGYVAPVASKPSSVSTAPSEVETFISNPSKVGDPRAVLHTSYGDITIRLFQGSAPRTVRNFIDLARGDREFADAQTSKKSRRPYFTNMIFHRVLSNYLIQTGCPFGNGRGNPGYTVADEFTPNLRFYKPYMVAMAPQRADGKLVPNSNGSQFFITTSPMTEWDDKFTIFGEVERGRAVVDKIAKAKVGPTDRPIRRIFLFNVDIVDETTASALTMDPGPAAAAPAHVPAPTGDKAPASVNK